MESLRARPYRGILHADGGPMASLEIGLLPVFGRSLFQVNARLVGDLIPRRPMILFSDADGTGTNASPMLARHTAISEALERWAYYATVQSADRYRHAFDVDESSNGMAAFPGPASRARRNALMEAIERFCLLAWWEGCAEARWCQTDWPDIEAIAIDGPFGGITVLLITRTVGGLYVYGHAAAESFTAAFEKAMIELARNHYIFSFCASASASTHRRPPELLERRMLFFASSEGYDLVRQRVSASRGKRMPHPALACDNEIRGPWSRHAAVWRCVLFPPGKRFLGPEEDYFFW